MGMNEERRKFEDIVTCSICLSRFTSPVMLPCRHTFCRECISPMIQLNQLTCPICRNVHTVPAVGFPTDFLMNSLLGINYDTLLPGNTIYNQNYSQILSRRNNVNPSAPVRPVSSIIGSLILPPRPTLPPPPDTSIYCEDFWHSDETLHYGYQILIFVSIIGVSFLIFLIKIVVN